MKATIFRKLCRARADLLSRKFDGRAFRPWHSVAVKILEVPIEVLSCFDLRHLWFDQKRKAYRTTWPIESAARPGYYHSPGTRAFFLEKLSERRWLVELVGNDKVPWYDSVEMDCGDLQEL